MTDAARKPQPQPPRTDTERLDWLAYDMAGSPLFDALNGNDVHSRAGELVDLIVDTEGGEEDDLAVQRRAYRQAFRELIDAAMDAGLIGAEDDELVFDDD